MSNVWTYWKCPSCQSLIRGDCRECPNCGSPIPAGVKYLMPDNPDVIKAIADGTVLTKQREVVTEAVTRVSEEQESDKPNWACSYCGFQNRFENSTCEGCGAGKEESDEDYFGRTPEISCHDKEDYERRTGTVYEPPPKASSPMPPPEPSYEPPHESKVLQFFKQNGKTFGIAVVGVLVLTFLIWLFVPITRVSEVKGYSWERSIAVEEWTQFHESDWTLPQGATLTDTRQEIHHYNQVLDHYETKTREVAYQEQDGYDISYRDLGNGQAEEVRTPRYVTKYRMETYQEPVYISVPEYRTKYYYDIERWKEITSVQTNGNDREPYWGDTDLPVSVSSPHLGDRKQGKRSESYYLIVVDEKGQLQEVEKSYSEWEEAQIGDTISYRTFRFSQKPL